MPNNFFYILFFASLISTPGCAQTKLASNTKVEYSGVADASVNDLKLALSKYNAGTIKITKSMLGNRTGQEFYLSASGGITEIKFTTTNSLQNAIYTYLDLLGFRWYGPGSLWYVEPTKLQSLDIKGNWFQPSFRNRQFFGTGGLEFATPPSYDPTNNYKAEWYAFKRRNRFNADFVSGGHMGSIFYLMNKKVLDQNSNWFANEEGKKAGRIKIENEAAVSFFRKYINQSKKESAGEFTVLNVEPEDGRGGPDDPLPPNSYKGITKWNNADKWWWLANEVAKDYNEEDKTTVVSMYAYGNGKESALAPSFRLRKNIYPILVPYAFQKAYQPKEMISTWASGLEGKMGIYDYWNITQWSEGLPQFDIFSMSEKLNFWHRNKIDGIYLETTDAFGPMGPTFWITGQLQWDLGKDFERLHTQFFLDCFGKAAAPIKRMYARWSKNYQAAADVPFSLQDLKEASLLVQSGSKEAMRINQLKAYVHYMKMYYEHNGTADSRNKIYQYLYSIHHMMLVQTAAFVGQQYLLPAGVPPQPISNLPITQQQIELNFQSDLRSSIKLYELSDFVFNLDKVKYEESIPANSWNYGRFQSNFFFKAPFTKTISIDVGSQINNTFQLISDDEIIIKDEINSKNFSYKEMAVANQDWFMKKISFKITKGKIYNLLNDGTFSRIKMNEQGIILFKKPGAQDFDNYNYPTQYFYVPKNTKEIIFSDSEAEGINGRGYLISPDGKTNKRESIGVANIYRVKVKAGDDGKLWTANFGHPSWSFKNIPNITSLQKFSYQE